MSTEREQTKKIQQLGFDLLCVIDDFCRENEITYFLSGGTCLGAVRHHGFIPWDDDVDIMMPRDDYERFIRAFHEQHGEKYGVGSLQTEEKWMLVYSRVWDKRFKIFSKYMKEIEQGIWIDIFPIEGLPKSKLKRAIHYFKIRCVDIFRSSCLRTGMGEYESFRSVKKALLKLLPASVEKGRHYAELENKLCRQYLFENSDYVGAISAVHYGSRETNLHDGMSSSVEMEFEGRCFPVPIGYDQYLRHLYGSDYMTVPPDTDDKYTHSHLTYWELSAELREWLDRPE